MATKTTIKGHGLKADGAAFDQDATRIDKSTAGGDGSVLCQCGALSPELPSRKKRIEWHRDHKQDAADEALALDLDPDLDLDLEPVEEAPALDLEPVEEAPVPVAERLRKDAPKVYKITPHTLVENGRPFNSIGHELEGDTGAAMCSCGARSSLNFHTDGGRQVWHQIHKVIHETPVRPEPDSGLYRLELPYREAAKHFWPTLGRGGAYLVTEFEFAGSVTVSSVDRRERTITLEGESPEEVVTAAERIREVWEQADGHEFMQFKRGDENYLKLGQTTKDNAFERKERLFLEGEFFLFYVLSLVEA